MIVSKYANFKKISLRVVFFLILKSLHLLKKYSCLCIYIIVFILFIIFILKIFGIYWKKRVFGIPQLILETTLRKQFCQINKNILLVFMQQNSFAVPTKHFAISIKFWLLKQNVWLGQQNVLSGQQKMFCCINFFLSVGTLDRIWWDFRQFFPLDYRNSGQDSIKI